MLVNSSSSIGCISLFLSRPHLIHNSVLLTDSPLQSVFLHIPPSLYISPPEVKIAFVIKGSIV